ncbi:hypothetical protein ASD19_13155 [Microbacterium sp. Root53]|uniref:GntR family transcriptional regulator n=1 Tax=Microbacterium sp. Root53 TaxID=1736553 RepID=UPI0006FE819D|nr:GntR family transcriptional regulator [Microbacterium sp. Root53]KQZ06043.1 hypothetical protein ASD19_13155 [Microbacterium sp. Root53]
MSTDGHFQVLGSITRTTRRELILDRLRAAVTSGQIPPGTHLGEAELSAQLGVSRGTLREALRHLQEEGLLSKDSRGRLSVRVVSPDEVGEIFAVRYALESLAIALVCEREDLPAIGKTLSAALAKLQQSEMDTLDAQVAADLAFHEAICVASGNRTLVDSWRRVSGLARATITAAGRETARENMSAARHAPILDAIVSGDAAEATAVLREHNDVARARIVANLTAGAS